MSDTMEIFAACAERLARANLQKDPDYQKYRLEWETLAKSFRSRHGRNHTLMDEMNDLQDAQSMVHFLEEEILFFLGLQMGLELGKIDLLREGAGR